MARGIPSTYRPGFFIKSGELSTNPFVFENGELTADTMTSCFITGPSTTRREEIGYHFAAEWGGAAKKANQLIPGAVNDDGLTGKSVATWLADLRVFVLVDLHRVSMDRPKNRDGLVRTLLSRQGEDYTTIITSTYTTEHYAQYGDPIADLIKGFGQVNVNEVE